MNELDFDWTDAGSPEDHACHLDALSQKAGDVGKYAESTRLHNASECIRGLAEENANLKAENDRLWLALDNIEGIAERALAAVKDK